MSDADVEVLRRLAANEGRLGQLYDQVYSTYVPLSTALSEAGGSLAGAALNVGTYSVGPVGGGATYSFDYPTTAKAVAVTMYATWGTANNNNTAYCMITGGGVPDQTAVTRGLVANFASNATGIVSLDSAAKFAIVVATANTTGFRLYINGYFL